MTSPTSSETRPSRRTNGKPCKIRLYLRTHSFDDIYRDIYNCVLNTPVNLVEFELKGVYRNKYRGAKFELAKRKKNLPPPLLEAPSEGGKI